MKKILQKLVNKILEFYNSLNDFVKIAVIVIGVVIIAICSKLLSNVKFEYSYINYKEFKIDEYVNDSLLCSDRLVFLKIEEVINELFMANNGEYIVNNKKVNISDLYKAVILEDYKYSISKSSFKNVLNKTVNDFNSEYGVTKIEELVDRSIIDKIYTYSKEYEMYIVKLNLQQNTHYVGIKFNQDNSYKVFYIS